MKVTADDFVPRRDGWFEHAGTWGEVTVGTVIANPERRSERWEVIAVANGAQTEYGHTLWMRMREQTTGAEHSARPKPKTAGVKILTQSPLDTRTAPVTPASDAGAVALLVEKLGASHLATIDNATGEITCPDYAAGASHNPREAYSMQRDEIEHLRLAHGMDTSALEAMSPGDQIVAIATAHGQAHNPKHPEVGKGGFPHRHVPEDLSIM